MINGESHPQTIVTMYKLGVVLKEVGKAKAAIPLLEAVYVARRGSLGEDHPDTLQSILAIVETLISLDSFDEAEDYQLIYLQKKAKSMGEFHPETLTAHHNLGLIKEKQGRIAGEKVLNNNDYVYFILFYLFLKFIIS